MASPCVLISSCTDYHPKEIARQILTKDELPDGTSVIEDIRSYPWQVDTKYYNAEVRLCVTEQRTIGDAKFADLVEAAVIYFDSKQAASFEQVKSWMPFLKEMEPAVLILACDNCTQTDAIPRNKVQLWCLDNGFELVEINPDVDEEDDNSDEDDFKETTGIPRIIQALQAHTWSNLVMKEKPTFQSPYIRQMMKEEAEAKKQSQSSGHSAENPPDGATGQSDTKNNQSDDSSAVNSKSEKDNSENSESKSENKDKKSSDSKTKTNSTMSSSSIIDGMVNSDMGLFQALGNEDPGEQSFEQLFENMRLMKEKAESMPLEQRKAYAEQVAISFWKAIGGDEDEIGGLDDDSD